MERRTAWLSVALLCCCIATVHGRLAWYNVTNSSALCNDFTRAGYFMRNVSNLDKWVIFFESGGLCYSNDTCNRRYFIPDVQERFARSDMNLNFGLYPDFDPEEAFRETVLRSDDPQQSAPDVVSTLMSSMQCFRANLDYFPNGFEIEGRDILDDDCQLNPMFCEYNHVVVPYCSSDLWIGSELDESRVNSTAASGECDCFDYSCFNFNPRSENLQYTFRGKIIFEGVIRDLMRIHGLGSGFNTEVVLVGSSAGGIGIMNNAKWAKDELRPVRADLRVVCDSSWFINFDDNIYKVFDGTFNQEQSEAQQQNAEDLFGVLMSNEACRNIEPGYPCCFASPCVMNEENENGEPYYPRDVPILVITSLYDIYLLAASLEGQVAAEDPGSRSETGYAVNFLQTVGAYGGEMNSTIKETASRVANFSYFATQCLQHVYLATSTLWGLEGSSVFGSASVEVQGEIASFRWV